MEHGERGRRSKERHLEIRSKSEPHIPEEIILGILSRLPYDSLCRLRCVSKQWSSLICDSKLIALPKRQKVIVLSKLNDGSFSFHSIDQHCSVEKVKAPWEKNLDLRYSEVHIYGSCNGLFLLGLKVDLYLWNPLNGYFKKVLSYHRLMLTLLLSITSGLCYDSSTNGYKAVMAFPPLNPLNPCDGKFVMVGDFRRKYWKEVCFPFNTRAIYSGPVLNGQLHWFASILNYYIFSFDPRVDEFKKVPMPKLPKDRNKIVLIGLGVLDGCLCMTCYRERNTQVWVMEAYGVQKSWNVRFVFSSTIMVYSIFQPLCCTKDGEVLMRQHIGSDGGCVYLYNSNGDFCRAVDQSPSICRFPKVAMAYEESLVEPTDYMWENEERRGIATYVEHFLSASPRKMIMGEDDSMWDYLDPKEEEDEGTQKKRSLMRNRQ